MAKIWTEEEVKRLERQRELQDRARAANPTAGMSFNERQRYKWEQERKLDEDRFRASHGGLSRAEVAAAGPNGSGRQYAAIRRGFELQAAREHEMKTQAAELAMREEEARQKRFGMENQGSEAAKANAEGAFKVAELNAGSADRQREHELAMLKQQQEFGGRQNDAERKNKLEIANLQGQSAVDVAKAQAEARAADIAAKNDVEREKIEARRQIAAMRVNGQLTKAGADRLGKTYGGLVSAGLRPAQIRQLLLDDGWTAEEIAAAQGRQQ